MSGGRGCGEKARHCRPSCPWRGVVVCQALPLFVYLSWKGGEGADGVSRVEAVEHTTVEIPVARFYSGVWGFRVYCLTDCLALPRLVLPLDGDIRSAPPRRCLWDALLDAAHPSNRLDHHLTALRAWRKQCLPGR